MGAGSSAKTYNFGAEITEMVILMPKEFSYGSNLSRQGVSDDPRHTVSDEHDWPRTQRNH